MPVQYDEILGAAISLPDDDRARLIDALIVTLAPPDAVELDDAWQATINRRSREIDEGSVALVSWADVRERARERRHRNG